MLNKNLHAAQNLLLLQIRDFYENISNMFDNLNSSEVNTLI